MLLLTVTAQVMVRYIYETHGFYKAASCSKSEWGDGVAEARRELYLKLLFINEKTASLSLQRLAVLFSP